PDLESALARPVSTRAQLGAAWFDSLVAGRYLVPVELDEQDPIRRRLARGPCQRRRLVLTIAATMGCDVNWGYCVEPERLRRRVELMGQDVQEAIVQLVRRELADPELEGVTLAWFGGEPLLAVDIIGELSRRLIMLCDERRLAYDANITTNGYNL